MLAYQAMDVTLTSPAAQLVVGASKTNRVVTIPSFAISDRGSIHAAVKITAASTTVSSAITAKLQTSTDEAGTWVDSKTVSISGNGDFYIKLNVEVAGDQTYLPLLPLGRVVITTGSGDATTITRVEFVQAV